MRIGFAVSQSVKPANEDAFGSRTDGAWVIDGATPLEGAPLIGGVTPAAWLSHAASDLLHVTPWEGRSLPEVLASVIEALAALGTRHGLAAAAFPTAAISVVRWLGGAVEVCSLGDCSVVVRAPGGKPAEIVDPQFDGAEEEVLARVRRGLASGLPATAAYQEVHAELRRRRRERNSPAGLWVLAADPEAAAHAAVEVVAAPPGTDVVLMSDGFDRVRWPFGLVADAAELVDRVTAGSALGLLDELRAREAADPDCARFLRFGAHDDATLVWARLG